jgi:hypothetical protein
MTIRLLADSIDLPRGSGKYFSSKRCFDINTIMPGQAKLGKI